MVAINLLKLLDLFDGLLDAYPAIFEAVFVVEDFHIEIARGAQRTQNLKGFLSLGKHLSRPSIGWIRGQYALLDMSK